jgi:hypothetical protein
VALDERFAAADDSGRRVGLIARSLTSLI